LMHVYIGVCYNDSVSATACRVGVEGPIAFLDPIPFEEEGRDPHFIVGQLSRHQSREVWRDQQCLDSRL